MHDYRPGAGESLPAATRRISVRSFFWVRPAQTAIECATTAGRRNKAQADICSLKRYVDNPEVGSGRCFIRPGIWGTRNTFSGRWHWKSGAHASDSGEFSDDSIWKEKQRQGEEEEVELDAGTAYNQSLGGGRHKTWLAQTDPANLLSLMNSRWCQTATCTAWGLACACQCLGIGHWPACNRMGISETAIAFSDPR